MVKPPDRSDPGVRAPDFKARCPNPIKLHFEFQDKAALDVAITGGCWLHAINFKGAGEGERDSTDMKSTYNLRNEIRVYLMHS